MNKFKTGDRVIVNTGGEDSKAVVSYDNPPNTALKDCVLVQFESGARHWMNVKHLRHEGTWGGPIT